MYTWTRLNYCCQKAETDGRNPERVVHYHGRIGLSGHKRELLIERLRIIGTLVHSATDIAATAKAFDAAMAKVACIT